MAVRPAGWRWRGTGARSTHGKEEGAAVAQAVGARLRGLQEEESVLLEALVPTARLPVPPPRKTPTLGCPPPWDGRERLPGLPWVPVAVLAMCPSLVWVGRWPSGQPIS